MRLTKKEKFEDQVWEVLFNHKALSKLDKLKLPSLDRKSNCLYQKTKEWAEVCESTKRYFIRIVENNTGTFLDREFKKARDCRKKNNGRSKTR